MRLAWREGKVGCPPCSPATAATRDSMSPLSFGERRFYLMVIIIVALKGDRDLRIPEA